MNETSHVDELGRERELGQLSGVRPLEHGHARVVAEPFVELAAADVESDHPRRAALEQDVGEAAGRGADVERVAPGRVDVELVEGVRELLPAARDEPRRPLDDELCRLVDLLARLLVAGTRPAITSACACARLSARPRSTSSTSSRLRTSSG